MFVKHYTFLMYIYSSHNVLDMHNNTRVYYAYGHVWFTGESYMVRVENETTRRQHFTNNQATLGIWRIIIHYLYKEQVIDFASFLRKSKS